MRQLTPGDAARKLAQIEHAERTRRWKKRAKAKLLKDLEATPVRGTGHLDTPNGRICAKRRFPSYTTAVQALNEAWRSPNPRRHEKRVYSCKHCHGWHLTSKEYEAHRNDRIEENTQCSGREEGQDQGRRPGYPEGS